MINIRLWIAAGFLILGIVLSTACTGPAGPQGPQGPQGLPGLPYAQGAQTSATAVISLVEPTVVRIDVSGSGFTASGSGFIVDARGYVLTNNHVIDQATQINVTIMDGSQYSAKVINTDANRDLAVIKLSSSRTDFAVATLGSSANVAVGQDVLAGGFPLGTELPGPATFTRGIVSAIRTLQNLKYVQTDVTINPRNSGEALVDFQGQVLGITTAGIVPPRIDAENIGLAIPIDEAKSIIQNSVGK